MPNAKRPDVSPPGEGALSPRRIAELEARLAALSEENAALRDERDGLRSVCRNLPALLCTYLPDTTLTYVNQAYADYVGQPPEKLLGQRVVDLLPARFADELKAFLRTMTVERPAARHVFRAALRGEERWHEWADRAFFDDRGRLTGYQAMGFEVTESKRAEMALLASEERFKLAMEASRDGLWDWNVATGEVYYSPGYAAMLGYGPDELAPHIDTWRELLHPDDRAAAMAANAECVGNRRDGFEIECRLRSRDGSWRWVLDRGKAVARDADGRALRMIGTHTDITESKRAEQDLSRTKEDLEHIFESSQVGIMFLRGGRVLSRGNQRLADILGYDSPAEMAGLGMRALHLSEERFEHFGESHYARLALGELIQIEYQLRRKDGTPVWCILSGKALDPDDLDKGVIWVIDDLEPRKAMEQELTAAKEHAEAANRAKSEFLANMSHEIRTPLNGILGMLQLMSTTDLNAEQAEYAVAAVQASRRLEHLLSDILDLSRVEAGKLAIHRAPFSVPEMLEQVRELFLPTSRQSGVDLRVVTDPALPERVAGDEARLQQICINLVGNAFKFTDAGSVTVEADLLPAAHPGRCRILFSVADTGMGIPEDQITLLFQPFSQAVEGYTRQHQGAGLGLSICKRLVALLGGNMSVESEPGRGSAFYFSIPFDIAPAARPGAGEGPSADHAHPLAGLSVLLAEDDRVSSVAAQGQLRKAGCSVTAVNNGREALDSLARDDFDLVLMDVQMPDMDGVEATRAIRAGRAGADRARVPVIALTAYAMDGDRETFQRAGMDGYVSKPVETAALMDELARVLRRG